MYIIKKIILTYKENGLLFTLKKIIHRVKYKLKEKKEISKKYKIKRGYHSFYQEDMDFKGEATVKVLAFNLPQYHTFPENDKWWGKGFTEWTNTRKSRPRFETHYQPREPHEDIGYYDLSKVENLQMQSELAKRHKIYGFCYYYYWFSGHRLMEKPLDLLLEHPEINMPFCLCWANENWTRAWDGLNKDILIKQDYTEKDKYNFIVDIKKYIDDDRYIRVNDKPIIIVYNPSAIPDVKDVFNTWKKMAVKVGIGEISIWIIRSFNNTIKSMNLEEVVDKEIEFPPHNIQKMCNSEIYNEVVGDNIGRIYDYTDLVNKIIKNRKENYKEKNLYRTVMLGWDNAARRINGFNTFESYDLEKYYEWLKLNICTTEEEFNKEERFTFINAWNEWAEGTYLEPDRKYGYANLNATTQAVLKQDFKLSTKIKDENRTTVRIAVQAHIFYPELTSEIIEYTNNIKEDFDLYISTDSCDKVNDIITFIKSESNANKIEIAVMRNRGRDVAPFLLQITPVIKKYKYFLHLHTKKSLHSTFGDEWRLYLYNKLIGSDKVIKEIIRNFDNDNSLGVIYPEVFYGIKSWLDVDDSNDSYLEELFNKLSLKNIKIPKDEFPAGNMFWGRVEAVKNIFEYNFKYKDFPEEIGQLDGTIMHAIERSWCKIAKINGYKNRKI